MIWNNKFSYPRTIRSIENGVRKYEINNEKLPSVTSVLSATRSPEELASLKLWEQRVGETNAKKIKNVKYFIGQKYINDVKRLLNKIKV